MAFARARTRLVDGIALFPTDDPYGRRSVPETKTMLGERRLRRWTQCRNNIHARPKNGVYDPITFFHLVEALANVKVERRFTASQLAAYLNEHKPMMTWDPVTVGRILNDIVETTAEANPGRQFQPVEAVRSWAGREYILTAYPAARAVLYNLVDDLAILGETAMEQQAAGDFRPRLSSPLGSCPSVNPLEELEPAV